MVKKSSSVAVVIPTIGREYVAKTLPLVIKNISRSVQKVGTKPFFIIEDSTPGGLKSEVLDLIRETGEKVTIVPAQGLGANEAWERGFKLATRRGAVAMLGCCDDFVSESRHFDKLVKPLLEGRAELTTGAWKEYGRNILSFPKPQYLSEIWVSRLMNYANPRFDSRAFDSNPFLKNPNSFQAFTGIVGLTPKALKQISHFVDKTFEKSSPEIKRKLSGWGYDPMRILVALSLGLRTANVGFASRRFEHKTPATKELSRFVASRLSQYTDAVDVLREFIVRTNQSHKLKQFDKMAAIIHERISRGQYSTANLINRKGKRREIYNRMKAIALRKK